MTYYYQLIFLGDTSKDAYWDILGSFMKKLQELGIDASCVKVINETNFGVDYSNCQPAFAFYLGCATNRERN